MGIQQGCENSKKRERARERHKQEQTRKEHVGTETAHESENKNGGMDRTATAIDTQRGTFGEIETAIETTAK